MFFPFPISKSLFLIMAKPLIGTLFSIGDNYGILIGFCNYDNPEYDEDYVIYIEDKVYKISNIIFKSCAVFL